MVFIGNVSVKGTLKINEHSFPIQFIPFTFC